eukprot:1147385-Pelagomonas_calceolata.AAC.1
MQEYKQGNARRDSFASLENASKGSHELGLLELCFWSRSALKNMQNLSVVITLWTMLVTCRYFQLKFPKLALMLKTMQEYFPCKDLPQPTKGMSACCRLFYQKHADPGLAEDCLEDSRLRECKKGHDFVVLEKGGKGKGCLKCARQEDHFCSKKAPRPSQRAKLLTLCSAQAKGRTPAADNALVTWSCKAMEACTSNQDAPIFSHSATPAALASSPFH